MPFKVAPYPEPMYSISGSISGSNSEISQGKINTDTSNKPAVIWTNPRYRAVLLKNWDIEIERNTGKNSMNEEVWVRESNMDTRESILKICCVAFLPEKIAESIVDE